LAPGWWLISSSFFQAYLDESGTHSGSPILAVAGYWGTQAQWDVYLDNWPHAAFHSSESRFDSLKPHLADAIDKAELSGVEACIRPWEFQQLASPGFKSNIGNAYVACAHLCALRICDVAKKSDPDARVSIVLEDGQPNVEWVQRLLISMMQQHPIASVTIAEKKNFPHFHAADFLSNSRSTTNRRWMDRLFLSDRVWEQRVEGNILLETSAATEGLLKEHRKRKAAAKRKRRTERKLKGNE
jgi:hypothetical protein